MSPYIFFLFTVIFSYINLCNGGKTFLQALRMQPRREIKKHAFVKIYPSYSKLQIKQNSKREPKTFNLNFSWDMFLNYQKLKNEAQKELRKYIEKYELKTVIDALSKLQKKENKILEEVQLLEKTKEAMTLCGKQFVQAIITKGFELRRKGKSEKLTLDLAITCIDRIETLNRIFSRLELGIEFKDKENYGILHYYHGGQSLLGTQVITIGILNGIKTMWVFLENPEEHPFPKYFGKNVLPKFPWESFTDLKDYFPEDPEKTLIIEKKHMVDIDEKKN